MRARVTARAHHPVYLLTYRGGDAQYYIIIGFPMRLKKKGNYMDRATGGMHRAGRPLSQFRCAFQRARCPLSQYAAHQREYDCFKGGAGGGIGNNALCESRAVYAAVGSEDVTPETCDDGLHCGTAGGLKLMDNVVCVDNLNAKLLEELGKQALPAGDSAC